MPALKEEDQIPSTPSQWFDGTEIVESSTSQTHHGADEGLIDEFDWVFGDYGLGNVVPTDSTIYAAFHSDHPTPVDEHFDPNEMYHQQPADMSWLPGPSTQDVADMNHFTFSSPYTIDPTAVMATNGMDEESSRPSSAPGLNGGEGSGQLLSVPMGDMMKRR